MSRKLKAPTTRRSVTKVSRRARNLERRLVGNPPTDLEWSQDLSPFGTSLFCDDVMSPVDPTNYAIPTISRWPPGSEVIGFSPLFVWVVVLAQSGFTPGTGFYHLSLGGWGGSIPTFDVGNMPFGQGWTSQHSSGITYPAFVVPAASPSFFQPGLFWLDPSDNLRKPITDSSPFTWAPDDTIFAGTVLCT